MSLACPLPDTPPWHVNAQRRDALALLASRRARLPYCKRLAGGGYCVACLRDVVGWRLPAEVGVPQPVRQPAGRKAGGVVL